MVVVGPVSGGDAAMSWVSMRGAMDYLHVGHKFLMGCIRSGEIDARVMPSPSGSDAVNVPLRINTDDLDALVRSWPRYADDGSRGDLQ